jgi:HK97 family phage prohead protease
MPKIRAAAKKFGVEVAGDSSSSRFTEDPPEPSSRSVEYTRSYGLEDISIRAGDGRTVDAYAAVFDLPTPIRDQEGEYSEVIDRSAFNSALANAAPSGGRERWRVGVFYNHGRTIWNTPSDLYSMPIGVPLEIRADGKGLFTRTKYLPGALGDSVLDAIREGSITGYSFSGAFTRSDVVAPRGGFRRARDGVLQLVRRIESTLREYGPTPFPAYADASIVGMRAEQAAMLLSTMPADEFDRFRAMFTAVADLPGTGGVTEAEPVKPAARSLKEELAAERREFQLRHRKD